MEASEYRIWQRVLEEPRQEAMGEALYRMAGDSRRAIRDYRTLAEHFRGAADCVQRKLEQWERENLESILGLFQLSTGRAMGSGEKSHRDSQGLDGTFLYRRALAQLQEYTALSAQPRFGVVFGEMAGRQRRICEGIARTMHLWSGK